MQIAVLGATGYIGRSLIGVCLERNIRVVGYTRDVTRATEVMGALGIARPVLFRDYSHFGAMEHDVIINASGVGSPTDLKKDIKRVFEVTEYMDEKILSYLAGHPRTKVYNLSSGAVYGNNASRSVIGSDSHACFNIDVDDVDAYALAKLASEAKHRIYRDYSITDLRVYSFFSRYLDVRDSFLLNQIVQSLVTGDVFETSVTDIVRDVSTADMLLDIVEHLYYRDVENIAYDVKTLAPVKKHELLSYLKETYGFRYKYGESKGVSPTKEKDFYCPKTSALTNTGYVPKETSLQGIIRELRLFLQSLP